MKKNIILLTVLMLLVPSALIVAGGTQQTGAGTEEEIPEMTLRFATAFGPTVTSTVVIMKFEELVTEKTGGNVTFDNYIGGALLGVTNTMHGIRDGVADMGFDVVFDRGAQPLLNACARGSLNVTGDINAPVLAIHDIYNHSESLRKEFESNNVFPMFFNCSEPSIMWSKKPITSIDQIKGLRIRAPESMGFAFDLMGASVAALPPGEIYEALQRNTLDATLQPFNLGASLKYQEVAPYITDIGFGPGNTMPFLCNLDKWNSFPQKLRDILLECGKLAEQETINLTNDNNLKLIPSFLAEGGKAVANTDQLRKDIKAAIQPITNNQTLQEALKAGATEAKDLVPLFHKKIAEYEWKGPVKYEDPYQVILKRQ
jgi:TRAP-type C4-dicarboxylate transport system substrate-binding protein